MPKLVFHSLRGEKSALCMVKRSEYEFGGSPVYVPRAPWGENPQKGDSVDIPDNFRLVDMVNPETGEVRTTESGEPLKVLSFG